MYAAPVHLSHIQWRTAEINDEIFISLELPVFFHRFNEASPGESSYPNPLMSLNSIDKGLRPIRQTRRLPYPATMILATVCSRVSEQPPRAVSFQILSSKYSTFPTSDRVLVRCKICHRFAVCIDQRRLCVSPRILHSNFAFG